MTEKGKIYRIQVPNLYCSFFKCWSDSSRYVCLSKFFLWLQGEASSYVFSLHTAWVIGEEAKWIYSQSKWGSGKSGQMACLNLRCPHCGKDDQLWKRQSWAIKCVKIWLPFIVSMENYVVSSPQALWDFLWGWPPEGIHPTLVTSIV